MSHVTEIGLRIRDLDALDAACQALGLELQREKKTFAWWGKYEGDSHQYGEMTPEKMGKCDHAIKIAGTSPRNGTDSDCAWEIGVMRAADGDGYKLFYDQYAGGHGLTAKVEQNCNALRREYATATATRKVEQRLAKKGISVVRSTVPGTKRIKLTLRKR